MSTATALQTAQQLRELVMAVREAEATDETRWVEWKGPPNLNDWSAVFLMAKAILGFANRNPDVAANTCEGQAYVVVGAGPGEVLGVHPRLDSAQLDDKLSRYVDGPHWTADYVDIDGVDVLVITVAAPAYGDRIHTLIRQFDRYDDGTVFIRRFGKTHPANSREMAMLQDRLLQGRTETLAQRFEGALDSANPRVVSETISAVQHGVVDELADPDLFPSTFSEGAAVARFRQYIAAARRYRSAVQPLLDLVLVGCRWGQPAVNQVWADALEAVAAPLPRNDAVEKKVSAAGPYLLAETRNEVLNSLALLPALLVLYGGVMAALDNGNYDAIRALTDAVVPSRDPVAGRGSGSMPVVVLVDPRDVFPDDSFVAALRAGQDAMTEVSDAWLAGLADGWRLRRTARSTFLMEELRGAFPRYRADRYAQLFDEAEMLLSVVAADKGVHLTAGRGPWLGRFLDDVMDTPALTASPVIKYLDGAWRSAERWAPLQAGLLGGSVERLRAAVQVVMAAVEDASRTLPY